MGMFSLYWTRGIAEIGGWIHRRGDTYYTIGMSPLKAPSPNVFQATFYQRAWNIVGQTVLEYVMKMLKGEENVGTTAEALVVLLPKVESPNLLSQFRQISLCNVVYRTITKTMVNILKPIMGGVVSPMQGSFVPGHQITNNIVICQEVIHTLLKKKGRIGG